MFPHRYHHSTCLDAFFYVDPNQKHIVWLQYGAMFVQNALDYMSRYIYTCW